MEPVLFDSIMHVDVMAAWWPESGRGVLLGVVSAEDLHLLFLLVVLILLNVLQP